MCVKQAEKNEIEEGDLSMVSFNSLLPAFKQLEKLVFSGVGEPLLHLDLEQFIAKAKNVMPQNSCIELQSNGSLLNQDRARSLLEAGLDVICLSMDAVSPGTFKQIRDGGTFEELVNAFSVLRQAKSELNRPDLRIGIEFVLMKQNISDLSGVVEWAAQNGASFIIVTHLLVYDKAMESQRAYSPNTDVSKKFYDKWLLEAENRNLDLKKYLKQRLKYTYKYNKTPEEMALIQMGKDMEVEAYDNDIPVNFRNLMAEDSSTLIDARRIFEQVKEKAGKNGIELILPELHPKYERKCHFVEDETAFISWKGQVHPCYFLWHQYSCYQDKRSLRVTARSFGNLSHQSIDDIWNGSDFQSFRNQVLKYEFPYCGNCILGPCNLFTEKSFEFDCYAREIPCGSCLWCGGLFHCLQ